MLRFEFRFDAHPMLGHLSPALNNLALQNKPSCKIRVNCWAGFYTESTCICVWQLMVCNSFLLGQREVHTELTLWGDCCKGYFVLSLCFLNYSYLGQTLSTVSSVQINSCPIAWGSWILLSGQWFLFLTCPTGKYCFLGKFKLEKDCNQSCQ